MRRQPQQQTITATTISGLPGSLARGSISSSCRMLVPLRLHLKRVGLTTAGCLLVLATFVILDGSNKSSQFDIMSPLVSLNNRLESAAAAATGNSRHPPQDEEDEEGDAVRPAAIPETEPKIVLYWTKFYNQSDFTFGFGRDPFIHAGCRVTNCLATADRSYLDKSDGVIFHAGQYNVSDLPPTRTAYQKFIFLLFETLPDSERLDFFAKTPHYFNWTMSHRRDADVYVGKPYGALRRLRHSIQYQLPAKLDDGQRPTRPESLMTAALKRHNQLSNRTKLMAWFNSHCPTHSRREDYVQQLGQHMQVDIYGTCGNLTCLPRNDPKCDETVLVQYKFYLAAENSLCPDYVTEKFYRALMNDVVPVVYGGADYTQYAPANSYINAADFASPKHLADYLLFLDQNEALYLKYFEWKKDWQVIRRPANGWCDLCEKLNDPNEPSKSYADMGQWWFKDVPCFPGNNYVQSLIKN